MRKRIYLSGAQQYAADAAGWREVATDIFDAWSVDVANPCKFDTHSDNELREMSNNDRFPELQEAMDDIVDKDLYELYKSDACLVYWTKGVYKGAGTKGEITLCKYLNKPVFIVLDEQFSIRDLPWWVLGCLPSINHVYEDFYKFVFSEEFKKWRSL